LFIAVDEAADQWFLANWDDLSEAQVEAIAKQILETQKRLIQHAS
jgi:hypothetical protein